MSMYLKSGKYVKPVVVCGPGRTKQSFKKSCDINEIVARYVKTGFMDHVRENPGIFADVSKIQDYQGMVSTIRSAQESFEQLPPELRSRFSNDPGKLIEFIADKSNLPEAIKLGLVPEPPAPKVVDAAAKKPSKEVKPPKAEKPSASSKTA